MNAEPILSQIAAALNQCRLEAVLIGNAAAALQGAPVTTLDFDFMFRKTPANLKKLRALADWLGGRILVPYYPLSGLYRVINEDRGLQLDFMSVLHGIKSFEGLQSKATAVAFGRNSLGVADLAVLEILAQTQHEKEKK